MRWWQWILYSLLLKTSLRIDDERSVSQSSEINERCMHLLVLSSTLCRGTVEMETTRALPLNFVHL